jgi:hypothetical protein
MEKPEIGHVTGQVANEINNHAPVTFVANYSPPPPPPSPTVQKMRDKMPPATHDALDWLMHHAHFSAAELYWACRQQGLVAPEGVLRQSRIARGDYLWSITTAIATGLMLLMCMLILATGPELQLGLRAIATAVVLSIAMTASLAVGVWPHETARKAVKALQERQA